jgi:hypothetical protein
MDTARYDVFVSYRRDGGAAEARLLRAALTERGLSVFMDVTDLRHGHFDTTLLDRIAECSFFVVILSPHALDRCDDEQDWLRQEIRQALAEKKQIIPVILPGFTFTPFLPADIRDLPRHQGVEYSHTLFDATVAKILDSIGSAGRRTLKPKMAWHALERRLGAVGVLPLALLALLPLGVYALLSHSVRSTIPALIGDYGVELVADDWTIHPLSLSAVARNMTLRPPHDRAATPPFSGDEVEFRGTLASVVSGLSKDVLHIVTFGWIGSAQPFTEAVVRRGELHLERSDTGRLNWADFWDVVPASRKDQIRSGVFPVEAIIVDRLKISYLEHIPGRSGGGVMQTLQATINVDDVTGSIAGLITQPSPATRPVTFQLAGRSADGSVAVSGSAAFDRSPIVRYFPYFPIQINVLLDNIGAAAVSAMMPNATAIVATRGSLRGTVSLDVAANHGQCTSKLLMEDVHLAPNPRLTMAKESFDRLQRDLANWKTSGQFEACKPFDEREAEAASRQASRPASQPVVPVLITALNTQAAATAPPSVRAAAAYDERSLGVTIQSTMNGAINSLTGSLEQNISSALGHVTLGGGRPGPAGPGAGQASPDFGNGVSKGVKSLGHGIKKLFGGGKDDKNAPPKKK